jgi:hypothetical protein
LALLLSQQECFDDGTCRLEHSQTPSAQKCYQCLRYEPLPIARHVGQHDKVLLNAILQKRDDITFGLDEGGENLA